MSSWFSFLKDLFGRLLFDDFLIPFSNGQHKEIGAGIAMLTGIGAALAQGYMGGKAVEALARNPEVEAIIFKQFIVGAAICESVAIYGLIIAIILKTT